MHYRDARTIGMMEAAFARVPRERIYEITGLQFLPFNSLYQLLAMRRANSPILEMAETLLMMPDLFAWLFTGRRAGDAPTPRPPSCSTRAPASGQTRSARPSTFPERSCRS